MYIFLTTFFMHILEVHFGALLMYIMRSAFQMYIENAVFC
jgi:hypothetical protein